ncbi:MAG TPA: SDR family oxidoreductase [Acidimicrobiales bacterium]|jgi:short-subunit dehydrogenase|nr:SDR family oxidoreductase [Acidimicrobiales bacterium]
MPLSEPDRTAAGNGASHRRTVVVTGASAGLGRAIALEFARQGHRVALLARDTARLKEAADEVEQAGGLALVVPTDVAEWHEVAAAASRVHNELGPVDIWVNNAMSSVFAPFTTLTIEEFTRATAVTYLGFVHGTKAALESMHERDRGVIVQVGSALAYRGIPLQSAYCGAKHAIVGFTSSLRTELRHVGSGIQVTMVHMPALNTPQFDWVRSYLRMRPQPVAPIYQPEVGARAVRFAAEHPRRRAYYVGVSTSLTVTANKFVPGLLDRYLARTGFDSQQSDDPDSPDRPNNLFEPVSGGFGAHGRFDARSSGRSPWAWLRRHAGP